MKKRDWLISLVLFLAVATWFYKPWEYFIAQPRPPQLPNELIKIDADTKGLKEEPPFAEFLGDPKIPVRIVIDALEIEAEVVGVGVTEQGHMDTTKEPYGIAWYEKGTSPGWKGNALLAGHNYWNGTPGSFVKLSYLPVGQEVFITFDDDSVGRFRVVSNDTYELADVPASVMSQRGETRTTLISCNGKRLLGGGYSQRTIVILKSIELIKEPEA